MPAQLILLDMIILIILGEARYIFWLKWIEDAESDFASIYANLIFFLVCNSVGKDHKYVLRESFKDSDTQINWKRN
jgi:hypothetical protein